MNKIYKEYNAVSVRELYFSYSKSCVLNGINLNVPKATIYGLLGSSGCGKTTLLRCILGRLSPKRGDIEIFGCKPGSKSCQIPGAGVGYMPQELGLYQEFTIAETLTYFGKIFSMSEIEINKQIDSLITLLQLPKKTKLIGKLSGGQQRRVSLATALFHSPPLLILDEPTVGVDPVLRHTIWSHLVSLCKSGLTIILTTHYIEEARSANVVAFMRDGKLLAEDNPNVLLNTYLLTNLEDVFLKLCYFENNTQNGSQDISICGNEFKNFINNNQNSLQNEDKCCVHENQLRPEDMHCKNEELECSSLLDSVLSIDKNQNNGIINKNNQNVTLFKTHKDSNYDSEEAVDQSLIIDNSIDSKTTEKTQLSDNKTEPKVKDNVYIKSTEESNGLNDFNRNLLPKELNIKNSYFSGRLSALLHKNYLRLTRNWITLLFYIVLPALELTLLLLSISDKPKNLSIAVYDEEVLKNKTNNWGQVFLNSLDNNTFDIKHYNTFESAYNSVINGKSWAAVYINARFSSSLRLRQIIGNEVDEETLDESQIHVHIDWSNQGISVQIERYFYEAIMKFAEQIAIQMDINPDSIKLPLTYEPPVYGIRDTSLRSYVFPGCYILLAFYMTSAVTAHLILDERRDGLLERSLVAGITAFEFLLSHALTQFLILCLQIVLMLTISLGMFKLQYFGSLLLVICLLLSQGLCGITFGLTMSSICSNIVYSTMLNIVSFFISIVMGGVFWPLENIPNFLRLLSYLLPNTLSIQSMRAIFFRGWSLCYFEVYIGFVATYLWLIFFVMIALIFLRRSF